MPPGGRFVQGRTLCRKERGVMLILTRKCNESIAIADNVTVTVLRVERGQVRLGIEAPRHIAVHRQEVYERIQQENREAAKISPVTVGRLARRWREANEECEGKARHG